MRSPGVSVHWEVLVQNRPKLTEIVRSSRGVRGDAAQLHTLRLSDGSREVRSLSLSALLLFYLFLSSLSSLSSLLSLSPLSSLFLCPVSSLSPLSSLSSLSLLSLYLCHLSFSHSLHLSLSSLFLSPSSFL
eukprot:SAG11_NODE_5954_length_1425_cov_5.387632_4_plen_131_part_00